MFLTVQWNACFAYSNLANYTCMLLNVIQTRAAMQILVAIYIHVHIILYYAYVQPCKCKCKRIMEISKQHLHTVGWLLKVTDGHCFSWESHNIQTAPVRDIKDGDDSNVMHVAGSVSQLSWSGLLCLVSWCQGYQSHASHARYQR